MNKIISIIIILSFFGSFYMIRSGLYISDIMCTILSIISIIKLINGNWKLDRFVKFSLGYSLIMLISSLLNFTIFNTQFLNYFRIFLWGNVIYIAVYNNLLKSKNLNFLLYLFLIFIAYFIIFSKNYMSLNWEEKFTSIDVFGGAFNLNGWGFTSFLIAIILSVLYSFKELKWSVVLAPVIILVSFMFLSYSRSTYILGLFYFLFYLIFNKNKLQLINVLLISALIISGVYIFKMLLPTEILEAGSTFFDRKYNLILDDIGDTRWTYINEIPINKWANQSPLSVLLYGDGLSIQHSFFSHTLTATGIIGFIYFLSYHILFIYNGIKQKYNRPAFFFSILLLIMLINDFNTNMRFVKFICTGVFMFGSALLSYFNYQNSSNKLDLYE